jgi:hypothetical protein
MTTPPSETDSLRCMLLYDSSLRFCVYMHCLDLSTQESDKFIDISRASHKEAFDMIKEEELDILFDLQVCIFNFPP